MAAHVVRVCEGRLDEGYIQTSQRHFKNAAKWVRDAMAETPATMHPAPRYALVHYGVEASYELMQAMAAAARSVDPSLASRIDAAWEPYKNVAARAADTLRASDWEEAGFDPFNE